jgi:hypothetical protein
MTKLAVRHRKQALNKLSDRHCVSTAAQRTFVEVSFRAVRVVTTRPEDDCALLLHGLVAPRRPHTARELRIRAGAVERCDQRALCRVTSLERKAVIATLEVETHKVRGEREAVVVYDRLIPTAVVHAGLQIRANLVPDERVCKRVKVSV